MDTKFISDYMPSQLSVYLQGEIPTSVTWEGETLAFTAKHYDTYIARRGNLLVDLVYSWLPKYNVLKWHLVLHNSGTDVISGISIQPLELRFSADPCNTIPCVRHLSGSWHYDACYPPRAFRVHEEAFMTHDHSKPVVLSGTDASEHVPILQFALRKNGKMSGFYTGFSWSGRWELKAGWENDSFSGGPLELFIVNGQMALGDIELHPGCILELPQVNIGFFEDMSWNEVDNKQRQFFREHLSAAFTDNRSLLTVSYNHWFGIYEHFDLDYIKRQVDRAAEIGCEYFCLDCAWYRSVNGWDGLGNWETPDPIRFPQGRESIRELSVYVRQHGMGFGLWHFIQRAQPGTDAIHEREHIFRDDMITTDEVPSFRYSLRLETLEGCAYAKEMLSRNIRDWNITWLRFESVPEDGFINNRNYNEVLDYLRTEFPNLYIEACSGGGTRLDLNMIERSHGNWLSDHTSNPDVCRFMQTGALRFWPVQYLNMAITAFRGRAGESATQREALSRMVGVLSLSGAISEWTTEQLVTIRDCVTIYKETRKFKDQPVFFPLPQPRSLDDWDIVLFGDGTGEAQLLFAYRIEGSDSQCISLPGKGKWEKLLGDNATLEISGNQTILYLPERGSALWIRNNDLHFIGVI